MIAGDGSLRRHARAAARSRLLPAGRYAVRRPARALGPRGLARARRDLSLRLALRLDLGVAARGDGERRDPGGHRPRRATASGWGRRRRAPVPARRRRGPGASRSRGARRCRAGPTARGRATAAWSPRAADWNAEHGPDRGAVRGAGAAPRRHPAVGEMTGGRARLLVLCYFYPPLAGGGVHRVLGFTRHLPRQGWECTVICAGREDYWVVDETLLDAIPAEHRGGPRSRRQRALDVAPRCRGGGRGTALRAVCSRPARAQRLVDDARLLRRLGRSRARGPRAGGSAIAAAPRFDALLSTSPPDSVHARRTRPQAALRAAVDRRLPRSVVRSPPSARRAPPGIARDTSGSSVTCSRPPTSVIAASASHADRSRGAGCAGARRRGRAPAERLRAGRPPDTDRAPEAAPDSDRFRSSTPARCRSCPTSSCSSTRSTRCSRGGPTRARRLRARSPDPTTSDYADRAVGARPDAGSSSSWGRSVASPRRALCSAARTCSCSGSREHMPDHGAGQALRVPRRRPSRRRRARARRRGRASGDARGRRGGVVRGSRGPDGGDRAPLRRLAGGIAERGAAAGMARRAHPRAARRRGWREGSTPWWAPGDDPRRWERR